VKLENADVECVEQAFGKRLAAVEGLTGVARHHLEKTEAQPAENLGLVAEDLIERRPRHARGARDVVHRCLPETIIDEDIVGGGQDRSAFVWRCLKHDDLTI
jgi:hypothetical protein